ncbi:[acyl-carrier-protein] S-malonyltransferase [Catalinimonas alkaloidigena]|uniref:ACP S-malonyltransferase n=1 Tax=Catalinimonas alkaloidigena TaxID=1075417 RepID=UPI002405A0F8|nr:ACP S-malonyltransferase [Catalinimonas alkaloidigena]MDF9797545.1 [acyl-carrier-protein] S-malonyltransferase [Catalinimonas alkaloidigena]
MKAYVFPGQGAQFPGMGKDLYENNLKAKDYFTRANDVLGFKITDVMFEGSEEQLKQTKITQPAIFLHSVVLALTTDEFHPNAVAGHSLGEISALVANGTLAFEDGLTLVLKRALAMQHACEINPSSMAAVLGLEDAIVEDVCRSIEEEIVTPANYNCPGQIVISGTHKGLEIAGEKLKEKGAKRVVPLAVGGAFHSPLMQPAHDELEEAINATNFNAPKCPIYQNVDALPYNDVESIKKNLIAQLTAPVRWAQSVANMISEGNDHFVECGPGKVLQGLIKKVDRSAKTESI